MQTHKIPDSVFRLVPHKARGGVENEHPAIFPVALATEVITAFSNHGDITFEPFCGSGTQLISAEINQRRGYAMEIAPQYTDIAVTRWMLFTGDTARHHPSGLTYEELAEQRDVDIT
jgi:DNA modification methylase